MKIAVIPGDGTGPEVTNEAIKVLAAVAEKIRLIMNSPILILVENVTSRQVKRCQRALSKNYNNSILSISEQLAIRMFNLGSSKKVSC